MFYLVLLIVSAIVAGIITPAVIYAGRRFGILDYPGDPRKIHTKPTPLLGGVAPFVALFLIILFITLFLPDFFGKEIAYKKLLGVFVGGLVLIIGGALDDRFNLKPRMQMFFSVLAVIVVVASGIGIREITNPFGGTISLVWWEQILFWWQGIPYRLTLPADIFTFVWLLGMIYTTKLLDGLDGLVSGLTTIGSVVILLLAATTMWYQPEVGVLAAITAGSFLGFLFWNFNPAKIFLGTGGSTFSGFMLGVLAVISGGKIATALLVFGIPIVDVVWVILRRVFFEKSSPIKADRKHLHHRLLETGLTVRAAVLILYLFAASFGALTLILQSRGKLAALGILFIFVLFGGVMLVVLVRQKTEKEKSRL